ncbi:MAG: T9SS type A sorting domain-containing protein [Ferruginibacter sp.]|nr:T9SS type A sorting domain-containing protein [Ferruginibacter sp.]
MKKYFIIIAISFCYIANAQTPYPPAPPASGNITNIEYFIDSKPEFGSGTALTGFTASANVASFTSNVNTTALASGFHRIYFRSKDATGKWSLTNNAFFDNYNVPLYNVAPAGITNITQLEYFIDNNDLGFGNCTPITITPNTNIANFNVNINVTGVPLGVHHLFIRSKDATGKWALTNFSVFDNSAQTAYPPAPATTTNIVQMEYFLDNNDLGFGNCTQIPVSANTNIPNLNVNVNVTALPPGVHRLFIRSKNATGKWSLTNFSVFDNSAQTAYPSAPTSAPNIVQMEYFLDNNDLGFGNCTQIPVTANTTISNFNTNVDVSGLVQGVHRLFIRSKDASGKWSLTNFSVFDNSSTPPYPNAPAIAPSIGNMEYYIDTDPGFGNATAITVPGNSGNINNLSINLSLSGSLSAGTHYLYIRSKQNPWSLTNVIPFSATSVVPLLWSFVKGQIINNQTLISWATTQEINTSKFDIEHSVDGIYFAKIGATAAVAGNSNTITNYNFTHLNPVVGFNYYRIKQIDLNGSFKYSVIVKVLNSKNIKQTIIAPNPVLDILNIVEPTETFVKSLEVYDTKGTLIIRKNINADIQVYGLPVLALSKGKYILKINYNNDPKTIPFIKD